MCYCGVHYCHSDGEASDLTDSEEAVNDITFAVTGDTSHHLWQLLTVFGRKHPIKWTDEMVSEPLFIM